MKILSKLWFWVLILMIILFIYPKECGYNYGGFIVGAGTTITREECSCFGAKYESFSRTPTWLGGGIIQMLDAGKNQYCIGIKIKSDCYKWTYTGDNPGDYSTETKINCMN
nr:hypothetical protein [Nanoarchaeum sp.]